MDRELKAQMMIISIGKFILCFLGKLVEIV